MRDILKIHILFLAAIFCIATSQVAISAEIPIIDTHSQVDHKIKLNKIIELMDKAGVSKTILSARGKVTPEMILEFAQGNPERIIPALRTKGNPYSKNTIKFYKLLKKQSKMAGFKAIAEVIMWHAQKGNKAEKVVVDPDDKRVNSALKIALEKDWPFIVHIEFAASGSQRQTFMNKFEKMLRNYPQHPFVLIHMGQLSLEEVTRLITEHQNIYFITAHTNPISLNQSQQPWVNMFSGSIFRGYKLDQKWKETIIKYSDRFILGFDNVFQEHWGEFYLDEVKLWKKVFTELPEDVAHKLAHKNAELLWNLSPL